MLIGTVIGASQARIVLSVYRCLLQFKGGMCSIMWNAGMVIGTSQARIVLPVYKGLLHGKLDLVWKVNSYIHDLSLLLASSLEVLADFPILNTN